MIQYNKESHEILFVSILVSTVLCIVFILN